MIALGSRWSWPALLSVTVLAAGLVSRWRVLERVGFALIALLAVCLIITVVTAMTLSAEGHARMRTVTAGDMLRVTYTIHNRGLWPVIWTLLRPQGFSAQPIEGQLLALPWRGTRHLDVAIPCPQRGRWVAGGWELHTGDPFGLFERIRTRRGRDLITVYPRSIPLPDLRLPAFLGRGIGPRGRPGPHPSATVREVRPYRPGDLPSRIHWLSTARLDALMVKDPEGEPASHAWLILDLQADVQYGEHTGSSVELLVGATGYLVQEQLPMWISTGLVIVGPETIVRPGSRHGQAERLLGALATALPGERSVAQGLLAMRGRSALHRSTIVVLTPWADARWSGMLPELVARGSTVVCLLLDTPDSGRAEMLDVQAELLRRNGVLVYRHSAWAA